MRDKIKKENYFKRLKEILSSYIGKSIYDERYGEMIVISYDQKEDDKLFVIAERKSDSNLVAFRVRKFKDINALQNLKDKAEELFYLDKQRVLKAREAQIYKNLFI